MVIKLDVIEIYEIAESGNTVNSLKVNRKSTHVRPKVESTNLPLRAQCYLIGSGFFIYLFCTRDLLTPVS